MAMGVCGYIESEGVRYWKPNMAALEGEWGRKVFDSIKSMPKLDYEKLKHDCEEFHERVQKARDNGTL